MNIAKLDDRYLEKVAGGNINYLSPGEVRRLNEILGDDGVVVCYGSGGSNSGDVGDEEIVVIKGTSPESLAALRAQGDIGDVQVVNGVRCVNASGGFLWGNEKVASEDFVAGRRILELNWYIIQW